MGFTQSKLDSAIWYRLREDESQYDYFSHHVYDFYYQEIKVSKDG
jgi:hypothetical protein